MAVKLSRRRFTQLLPLGFAAPLTAGLGTTPRAYDFRIRTLTAGLQMGGKGWLDEAERAARFLFAAREAFVARGYEVQTLRIATQPFHEYHSNWASATALETIKMLDKFALDHDLMLSIGPVVSADEYHAEFADWAVERISETSNISFSLNMASEAGGVHHYGLRSAAEAILAIAHGTPGGAGNFRFAANAFTPAGTPFFPAAYFDQGRAFSIGLESPNLLTAAFKQASNLTEAKTVLSERLHNALEPIALLATEVAAQERWRYLGIDTSPAPGLDASIGAAIENLTGEPFGSASTLAGCAAITSVLQNLRVLSCGYSGLMLPIMEDPVLARRAAEHRYGISELLLYSSVCGTGLDVVPIPGNSSPSAVANILTDVAALAARYQKPLSARLFPAPGLQAGDTVRFDNPHLTDAMVMST
jgi:uncharacterized protein (UPF0210 family)